MSEHETSGTYVSLKEHFEARVIALEKATVLAANQMEKRLESMNEFRAQLRDQAAGLMPRAEFAIVREKLESDIRMLRESKSMLEGKASQQSVNVTMAIAILSMLVALGSLLRAIL